MFVQDRGQLPGARRLGVHRSTGIRSYLLTTTSRKSLKRGQTQVAVAAGSLSLTAKIIHSRTHTERICELTEEEKDG